MSQSSKELSERALNEAKSISQFFPETTPTFIRPDQEKHFCNLLMNQRPDAWKEYVCHKIYQSCKLFADVELKRFIAEFADDGFGNLWLVDVKIYDITFSGIEGFQLEKTKGGDDWSLYTQEYLSKLRGQVLDVMSVRIEKFSRMRKFKGITGEIFNTELKLEDLRKRVNQSLEIDHGSQEK